MATLTADSAPNLAVPPTAIPPRTSSHSASYHSTNNGHPSTSGAAVEPSSSSSIPPISPPRKSSKRPVSTTSENWLAQSNGKKPLTATNLSSMTDADHLDGFASEPFVQQYGHKRQSSHSHRHKLFQGAVVGATLSPARRAPSPPKDFGNELIYAETQPWSDEKEKLLMAPYDYLFGHPGKDVRGQLIAAFNEWLKVPDDKLQIITKVIGMLQTASLLYVHQASVDYVEY
jgi:geranylgeranyl diphosphate synthase type 3